NTARVKVLEVAAPPARVQQVASDQKTRQDEEQVNANPPGPHDRSHTPIDTRQWLPARRGMDANDEQNCQTAQPVECWQVLRREGRAATTVSWCRAGHDSFGHACRQ